MATGQAPRSAAEKAQSVATEDLLPSGLQGGRRRALRGRARVVAFNAAWTLVGLVVIALAGEGWARSRVEFRDSDWKGYIHPRAGRLYVPGSESRHTNMLDFWAVTRANRQGFLDRPPPPPFPLSPEDGHGACRVAFFGDSYLTAQESPVAAKVHVRLEKMASERLPALRVATSAFGHQATAQISWLGYYDEFASRTSPHVVVLTFTRNDFAGNYYVLHGLRTGYDPDRLPWTTARRSADGIFSLRAPDPRAALYTAPPIIHQPSSPVLAAVRRAAVSTSHFAALLDTKIKLIASERYQFDRRRRSAWDSRYSHLFVDWKNPVARLPFNDPSLPWAAREAIDYTGFALDEWTARAQRDNFFLVILAIHSMRTSDLSFERMHSLASARDIPVVDQYAYIVRQNNRPADAQWKHDHHWNAAGHQWAAEALLEWLEHHQELCPSGREAN